MAISAADVKKLRDRTGAGLMDCKKALAEADGDFDKAERLLKEMGKAAAVKKAGRATNQGRVFIKIDGNKAGILELTCETDFVARNEQFVALGTAILDDIMAREPTEVDTALEGKVKEGIAALKENIGLPRFRVMHKDNDTIFSSYSHGEQSIQGAVVAIKSSDTSAFDNDDVKQFVADAAVHAAMMRPQYLDAASVDEDYRREQEDIFTKQAEAMGKPENVTKGIVQGKLKKHFGEICFVDQEFVVAEKQSVTQVAKEIGKKAGADLTIVDYTAYVVGQE